MKQLLILSGKGGAGKTSVSAAFIDFSRAKTFADCDVDAPNLHLVAGAAGVPEERDFLGGDKATILPEQCTVCGQCKSHCRFHAISAVSGHMEINPMLCEGCGVCSEVCPADAIEMRKDVAGKLTLYQGDRVFSTAKLRMGQGTSGKLVAEVKKSMREHSLSGEKELAIIDGSPGIGCPVISSISGVDMVLIVTEPSLSGISDMKRILETCRVFGAKTAVCINRYDTCSENSREIEAFCLNHQIPFVGKIPYDAHIPAAVNRGTSIAAVECPAQAALKQVYRKVINLLEM